MVRRQGGLRTVWLRLLAMLVFLAAGLALGSARPASAAAICQDDQYIVGETIKSDLVVPQGAFCILEDTTVRGGVTVEAGAGLSFWGGVDIRGSIVALEVAHLLIGDAVVRGGITVTGATAVSINQVEARGNVSVTGGHDAFVDVINSTISGSLTVSDNNFPDGFIRIYGNVIDVDLACFNNTPVPSNEGIPNTAGGARLGQCAGL